MDFLLLTNVKVCYFLANRCPVMLVAGDYSPHLDETVNMNGRMDPANSTWMKVVSSYNYVGCYELSKATLQSAKVVISNSTIHDSLGIWVLIGRPGERIKSIPSLDKAMSQNKFHR